MKKEVTSRELGKILGITTRRVNQIADEGKIFRREISGKFDVVKCVHDYYQNKFLKNQEKIKYEEERALHEKAKREKAELQLRKLKGELHEAETVELVLTNMLTTFRTRILAIPSKVSPRLIGQNSIGKINEILETELREALAELSEYDPAIFVDDEDDILAGGENDAEDTGSVQKNTESSSATSKPDSERMGR